MNPTTPTGSARMHEQNGGSVQPYVQGAPGATDAERAAWLADKIVAHGDYAKEAAAMLRRWPAGIEGDAWVAQVVSSGPHNFQLLQWRSADISLSTPIGTKLYAAAGVMASDVIDQHNPEPGFYWVSVDGSSATPALFRKVYNSWDKESECLRVQELAHWLDWTHRRNCVQPEQRDQRYRILGRIAQPADGVPGTFNDQPGEPK